MPRAQVVDGDDGDGIGMTSRDSTVLRCSATALRAVSRALLGACMLGLAMLSASAQETQPSRPVPGQAPGFAPAQAPIQAPSQMPSQAPSQTPGQPPSDPATAAPDQAFRPGFIDALGRWLEEGASKLKSGVQGAQEKVDQLGSQARDAAKEATKEATGSVLALPGLRPVTARERCALAQNGAPDCQAAAITLCRGKGFQTGKSLDTQTEQKCSGKFLLEGRAPNATDCPPEMFVTRAMCQ
jgi:hypothetical protein